LGLVWGGEARANVHLKVPARPWLKGSSVSYNHSRVRMKYVGAERELHLWMKRSPGTTEHFVAQPAGARVKDRYGEVSAIDGFTLLKAADGTRAEIVWRFSPEVAPPGSASRTELVRDERKASVPSTRSP
jgi:hypothetical protein